VCVCVTVTDVGVLWAHVCLCVCVYVSVYSADTAEVCCAKQLLLFVDLINQVQHPAASWPPALFTVFTYRPVTVSFITLYVSFSCYQALCELCGIMCP